MKSDLSIAEARRVVLGAQGFTDPRPAGRVDARHVRRVLDRIGLLQIDSVNVLARAHYLPLFSRLGPYPMSLLDDLAYRRRELFEYWGHAASLIPTAHYPLFRHRMEERRDRIRNRASESFGHDGYVDSVLAEVRDHGPLIASGLSDGGESRGPWWGWGKGKLALEALFEGGDIAVGARPNFARAYDLAERVIPADALAAEPHTTEDAHRELLVLAARASGVGTSRDLADYYRVPLTVARARLGELVDAGRLEIVRVEGWREPAYATPDTRLPRAVTTRALLAPFDSLVWNRDRVERLFDFHYRIEIYVPEPQRRFGYYVLPFLLDERLVGRVDLKADRAAATLIVRAAHAEPGERPAEIAAALTTPLAEMAQWLELDRIAVEPRGDVAADLAAALSNG
ncbi:MAG: winged helix DNA-binding domain-containing protein [Chloroflexi bacterium]|nr:winged helix DNA-binding domain-containing protein [Chloroflexota bacterium]